MTPVLEYLTVAVAILVSSQLLLGLWYRRKANVYRLIARTERIRLQLGDARCRLITETAKGNLKPSSVTFRELYFVQTSLMRGTDHYPALSEAMWRKVLRFEKSGQSAMAEEAKQWTSEVRAIAIDTAEVIKQIWIGYVPFGVMLRIAKHIMIRLQLASYDKLEAFSDHMLDGLVVCAERTSQLLAFITFKYLSNLPIGVEVRLAVEMRQAERILREVSGPARIAA
jgi:hypothetical protein